jgi:DNA polymerase-3 subunit alpha
MAFGTLEDYRGEMDLAFFGDVWSLYRDKIHQDDVIAVSGKVDVRRGKPSLQVAAVLASGDLTQEKINGLNAAGPSQKSNRSAASNMEALDKYREVWEQNMTLDLSAPEQGLSPAGVRADEGGSHILVGILASTRTHIVQKTQKEMAFGTLEDYRSEIDLVFFDRCWENNKDKLIEKTCIALKGKLDLSRDRPSFLVSSLLDLGKMRRAAQATAAATPPPAAQPPSTSAPPVTAPTAAAPATAATAMAATSGADPREVHIRLHDSAAGNENSLYPIRDYIVEHPGTAAVFIHIPPTIKHKETVVRSAIQLGFAAEEEHINALKKNPGVAEIWVA